MATFVQEKATEPPDSPSQATSLQVVPLSASLPVTSVPEVGVEVGATSVVRASSFQIAAIPIAPVTTEEIGKAWVVSSSAFSVPVSYTIVSAVELIKGMAVA